MTLSAVVTKHLNNQARVADLEVELLANRDNFLKATMGRCWRCSASFRKMTSRPILGGSSIGGGSSGVDL
jgi:hypothetical protein